ncbi:MAG: S-layer homology domain-containing protein [Oscillospiraceae bacterium]|nr:S-layer homology domain-containing protein [Oscillospiraceae bacterium]
MIKGKFLGTRAMAFMLCVLMVFTMFTFAPITASAQTLHAPTNLVFDANTGEFSWLHQGPQLQGVTFEIQNDIGIPLWSGTEQRVHIRELNLAAMPLNWQHAVLPTFVAQVVARQTTAGGIVTSSASNMVTVNILNDAQLNQTLSLVDSARLTWMPQFPGQRPTGIIYRIYVNNVFRTTVTDRTEFDLETLNLTAGQTHNIFIRTTNPSGFAISQPSNTVSFTPASQGFTITVSATGGGSVMSHLTEAPAGTTVTLTATPNAGSSFSRWEVLAGGFVVDHTSPVLTFIMPAQAVSIRAVFDAGHQISVTRNNNYWGTASANVGAAMPGITVTLTATPTVGNRFVRWEVLSGNITLINAESATTQFVMPNTEIQIRAVFETGSGVIAGNVGQQVSVNHTLYTGNATLDLPQDIVNSIITATSGATAIFDMTRVSGVETVTVPRAALNQFANANLGVEFRMVQGSGLNHIINLDRFAVASLVSRATGNTVSISMYLSTRTALTTAQQNVLAAQDAVYNFRLNSVNQVIDTFDGLFTITVPYTGQTPVAVRRLAADGTREDQPSTYNAAAHTVTFSPTQPFYYLVGSVHATTPPPPLPPVQNPFSDIHTGQWFYDDVMFVFGNNLMGPTSINPMVFNPNANLSRAMIVTILHRREGTPPPVSMVNPFTDVPSGQWFTEAVIWAAENGIVMGFGGRFSPNANISRQDLAVILMRYADFIGAELPMVATYVDFADQSSIQSYAVPAIRQAVESGIITGRVGNLFAPLDNSTRAEAAAVLHRFISAIH